MKSLKLLKGQYKKLLQAQWRFGANVCVLVGANVRVLVGANVRVLVGANVRVLVGYTTESNSEWQFRVDMWFNAWMKLFLTVFRVVKYPLFDVLSTVQLVRVIV